MTPKDASTNSKSWDRLNPSQKSPRGAQDQPTPTSYSCNHSIPTSLSIDTQYKWFSWVHFLKIKLNSNYHRLEINQVWHFCSNTCQKHPFVLILGSLEHLFGSRFLVPHTFCSRLPLEMQNCSIPTSTVSTTPLAKTNPEHTHFSSPPKCLYVYKPINLCQLWIQISIGVYSDDISDDSLVP